MIAEELEEAIIKAENEGKVFCLLENWLIISIYYQQNRIHTSFRNN